MMKSKESIFTFFIITLNILRNGAIEYARNDATDEFYNDVLIHPIIGSLTDIILKKKDPWRAYVPNDIALVQTISSLQDTMFQLSLYYSLRMKPTQKVHYGKGLAIQFETSLCDQVYSSKFPRTLPPKKPWSLFTDSLYFRINCDLPIIKEQYQQQGITTMTNSRKRRQIVKNSNPICGKAFVINQNFGSLHFPHNSSGNYSTNMECEWTIRVAPSFGVMITFVQVLLEYDPKCFFDSIALYEGFGDKGELIARTCGNVTNMAAKSKRNVITIKFTSDDSVTNRGFTLQWALTDQTVEHSGYLLTSTIVVDQVGDLNIDLMDFDEIDRKGQKVTYEVKKDFEFLVHTPVTCPLESDNPECFFGSRAHIISKIIASGVYPNYRLQKDAIEIAFDHVIQSNMYPDLYISPKYCVTWDPTVKKTKYGSWSRHNGKNINSNVEKTICSFSATGIHAVIAMEPPPIEPPPFQFTNSWYCGNLFAILWITITFIKMSSWKMNIPDWLNFNQLVAIMIFCSITIAGMHMESHETGCSMLTFTLYFFGLATFVWHLLKAAQFTGEFDKFFRQDRNLYAFYLMLGWGSPFFVVSMAAGVRLLTKTKSKSCWMEIKDGPVWGYAAPAYFIVLAIFFIYYKGLKMTEKKKKLFNYPKLIKRAIRDALALTLLILSWGTGVMCFHKERNFFYQYLFAIFLSLAVVLLCLFAKQRRRNFLKIYDYEDLLTKKDYFDEVNTVNVYSLDNKVHRDLAIKYLALWKSKKKPQDLKLALKLNGFKGATVVQNCDKYCVELLSRRKTINARYLNSADVNYLHYNENDDDGEPEEETLDYSEELNETNDFEEANDSKENDGIDNNEEGEDNDEGDDDLENIEENSDEGDDSEGDETEKGHKPNDDSTENVENGGNAMEKEEGDDVMNHLASNEVSSNAAENPGNEENHLNEENPGNEEDPGDKEILNDNARMSGQGELNETNNNSQASTNESTENEEN